MLLKFFFYLGRIFLTPLSDLTGLDFVVLIVTSAAILFASAFILYILGKGCFLVGRGTKNIISAKSKCQKIQCKVCGRTLDRCICQKNKNRGNASRLYNYKKEEREHKKSIKKK